MMLLPAGQAHAPGQFHSGSQFARVQQHQPSAGAAFFKQSVKTGRIQHKDVFNSAQFKADQGRAVGLPAHADGPYQRNPGQNGRNAGGGQPGGGRVGRGKGDDGPRGGMAFAAPPEPQMFVASHVPHPAGIRTKVHMGQGKPCLDGRPPLRRGVLIGLGRKAVVETRLFNPLGPGSALRGFGVLIRKKGHGSLSRFKWPCRSCRQATS